MAKTFEDYQSKVARLVREKSQQTSADDVISALENAADTLRLYRTDTKVKEYTADGGRLYTLPTDWDVELTSFTVEYPVNDNADQVQYLDRDMTELYNTPDGMRLRFRSRDGAYEELPASGAKFRLHYQIAYQLSQSVITVPSSLFHTTCKLGARELCLIMSTRYAQQAGNVVDGSSADYRDKSDKFLSLAKEFWKDFQNSLTAAEGTSGKVSFGVFKQTPGHRDQRMLYPRDASNRSYAE